VTGRSREPITGDDLARLGDLALRDLAGLVERKTTTGRRYRNRLLCIALCRGAAQHYLDGENGVKDFDVWSFFAVHPAGPFPYRRRVERDLAARGFHVIQPIRPALSAVASIWEGRSLPVSPRADPVAAVRSYLAGGARRPRAGCRRNPSSCSGPLAFAAV
jgi:hypothetical protein